LPKNRKSVIDSLIREAGLCTCRYTLYSSWQKWNAKHRSLLFRRSLPSCVTCNLRVP